MIYLALDVGTTGLKAALLSHEGEVLATASATYPSMARAGGIVEQDVSDWWQATMTVLQTLDTAKVQAIVLTGQMQDLILLDSAGHAVRPVILYSDSRATAEAEAIKVEIGVSSLREVTGNDQESGSLLAKLRWLQIHEPASLKQAKYLFLGAAEYLAFKLTARALSDTTTASTSGLMDLGARVWATELIKELYLQEVMPLLSELVPGGLEAGKLKPEVAQSLGLRAGMSVYLAPGDAGTASLGIGSGVPGRPYAYMGTSGWVAYSSSYRAEPSQGVFTLAHPEADLFICVAPLLTAGGNLDWAKEQFGFSSYDQMIKTAMARPQSSLLYLPYLNGERAPFSDPKARGAFIGLSASHTQADMARAVLEGVAFAYQHALNSLIQEPLTDLLFTGGGSRSNQFSQLLADIVGLTVSVPESPEFIGLRGAVLAVEAVKTGRGYDLSPDLAKRLEPKKATSYEAKYEHFLEAYRALKNLFQKL